METKYYRAYFHWFIDDVELSKGDLDFLTNKKGIEELLNDKFMEAQNRGAVALNGYYKEWNEEYNSSRGKDPNEDSSAYEEFICQKQNEILKKVPDDVFELFTDPYFGESSICGRLKNVHNKNVKVQVLFKAV